MKERGAPNHGLADTGRTTRPRRRGRVGTAGLLVPVLLLGLFLLPAVMAAQDETANLLDSAEALFKAMKIRNYPEIWMRLTSKSHKIIAEQVCKAIEKAGETGYSVALVEQDFAVGGPVARSYWNAYLDAFHVDYVLEQSTWEIGFITADKAEICLLYRKAGNPARLKMLKERNQWKVGLMETFRGRN
jgi:hypothetical protein